MSPSNVHLGFWRITVCSAIVLAFHLATLILHLALFPKRTPIVFPASIIGIFAAILALCSAILHLRLWQRKPTKTLRRWSRIHRVVQQLVCLFAFTAVLVAVVTLTLGAIGTSGERKYVSYFDLTNSPKVALAVLVLFGILSDAALAIIVARLTWWPVHRAARSTLTITSLLLLAIGTILVSINRLPFVDCDTLIARVPTNTFSLHQQTGAIISTTAILGLAVCSAIKEGNRINVLLTRFITFYLFLASFTALLCIVIATLSLVVLHSNLVKPFAQQYAVISDPVLAGTALLLLIVNLVAANYLQEPPALHLSVERFDLAALNPAQREAYAARITKHGKQVPGAPNGEAAMALMLAYTSASIPNATCTVLRVFRPATSIQKLMQRSLLLPDSSYEDDRAWQNLDEEQMVLRQTAPENKESDAKPPKLSKYQQKKMARKRAAKAADGNGPNPTSPISSMPSPVLQADLEFTAKLESTEALVMLTAINDYDLTAEVKGWPGRLLQCTLGSKSLLKPLCVRFGLLAFHWPFRQSTFYCSPARRPVARSAAVLRAIAAWNRKQPPAQRCAVLLDPTYRHEVAERAITPGGWQRMPLPASHIVDLRSHKGQTLAEYLHAVRYRDQESAFRRAGGEVVEVDCSAFGPGDCADAMRLWRQIADKRTADGQTAVLATPDERFLATLGERGKCSLMFLRVGGQAVASCVLFHLGDTLTSDLQGLDYERARPLKAYFVMMQHVIAVALRDGYSFVDFGPTTAKPKLDIGCKSVPLIGAMHAISPVISLAMRVAAVKTKGQLEGK